MIYFIYNPISGGKGNSIRQKIELDLNKIENSVLLRTEYINHATELAQFAIQQKAEKIIVIGGDGTINEVARQLIGSDIPLGIVPMGSGNGLSSHLGLPKNYKKALQFAIQSNQSKKIDVAYFNEKPFFCTAGIGFDAVVAHEFSKSKKRGFITYISSSFKMALNYNPILAQIELEESYRPYFSITFANANQFGNNAFISPGSNVMDNQFEVVLVKPVNFIEKIKLGISLFTKSIQKQSKVQILQTNTLSLNVKNCSYFHLDGETFSLHENRIQIKLIPNSLKIIF